VSLGLLAFISIFSALPRQTEAAAGTMSCSPNPVHLTEGGVQEITVEFIPVLANDVRVFYESQAPTCVGVGPKKGGPYFDENHTDLKKGAGSFTFWVKCVDKKCGPVMMRVTATNYTDLECPSVECHNAKGTQIDPHQAPKGSEKEIKATADSSIFVPGQSVIDFGPFINVVSFNIVSAHEAYASITIPSDTPIDDYPVVVTTGSQIDTVGCFSVYNPMDVPSITEYGLIALAAILILTGVGYSGRGERWRSRACGSLGMTRRGRSNPPSICSSECRAPLIPYDQPAEVDNRNRIRSLSL